MKISKILVNMQNRLNKEAIIRREKEIENFVNIHDVDTYGDSFSQMYTVRDGLADYAKSKGVRIDIYKAAKEAKNKSEVFTNELSSKINVVVTNLLSGKKTERFVSADTTAINPKVKTATVIIPLRDSDTERLGKSVCVTEDNFLRNLYRNIEEMTHTISRNKAK